MGCLLPDAGAAPLASRAFVFQHFPPGAASSQAEKLREALANTNIVTPEIPVLSNVDVSPHSDPDTIKAILTQQVPFSVASSLCHCTE